MPGLSPLLSLSRIDCLQCSSYMRAGERDRENVSDIWVACAFVCVHISQTLGLCVCVHPGPLGSPMVVLNVATIEWHKSKSGCMSNPWVPGLCVCVHVHPCASSAWALCWGVQGVSALSGW